MSLRIVSLLEHASGHQYFDYLGVLDDARLMVSMNEYTEEWWARHCCSLEPPGPGVVGPGCYNAWVHLRGGYMFAFGPPDAFAWPVIMVGAFALLYSKELPIRLAGLAFCVAAFLIIRARPSSDGDQWFILAILSGVFLVYRPSWFRWRDTREVSEHITVLPERENRASVCDEASNRLDVP